MKLTRRDVLTSVGATVVSLTAMSRSAVGSISFRIRNTFLIPEGTVRNPTRFSYDMFEWEGDSNEWGVLEFEDGDYAEFGDENSPLGSPAKASQIDLPMSFNPYSMNIGVAIWLSGMMSILLGGSWLFKNYAAGIMWGLALVLLILSGLLDIGLELFWLTVVFTIVLLIAGLVVRWSR